MEIVTVVKNHIMIILVVTLCSLEVYTFILKFPLCEGYTYKIRGFHSYKILWVMTPCSLVVCYLFIFSCHPVEVTYIRFAVFYTSSFDT
jgi:hypothetical protein